MSSIDPTTGEATGGRSQRFVHWTAFLFFSAIALASIVQESNAVKESQGDVPANQGWAIALCSITFALCAIIVIMQLHPIGSSLIVGTKVEGAVIVLLVGFWIAIVSIISDGRNLLSVNEAGTEIINGNLYYFSWAGFVCSVMLLVSYLRAIFGVDLAGELRNRSERLTVWSALLAAQLVVMGASSNIFDLYCGGTASKPDAYCGRTTFGIVAGVIGTLVCLAIVGMKIAASSVPFVAECCAALVLTTMNAFVVAYMTSPAGPGSSLGNLYYFSWISLVTCCMLIASCFETYKSGGESSTATNAHSAGAEMTSTNGNGVEDIAVDPLDNDENI
mmetsp:Transcript_31684/g.46747  ORF Transcript_31684/g.46747 Transcript_31684/m.46747 type:complete len:333 (-) Transcript_31684:868-1866(-)|eukprot:CAMPEP_0194200570 /NCGR_PEP_ID=MMETSP0156-20130528/1114_1 /TAXON_ID=33649 /ORGANISM="Thalassionema nitzschioides, Strain L26-B" /LENGTH=332 /DNA_ID=CAMNT_0038925579 /DNA_START=64 /DNA_END=1062 /DNA_ORIENTATION=+